MKYLVLFFLVFFCICSLNSQNFREGKLQKTHFEIPLNEEQLSAPAVVLSKKRNTSFFIKDVKSNWKIIDRIYKVIKINTQEGYKYGTVKIRLYNDNKDKESISKIVGNTYNIIDGKIVKKKINDDAIFTNRLNDNWTEISIVLPQIKENSIIEYSYEIKSPFWKIDDVVFQEEIPVRESYAKVSVPQFFNFKRFVKGYLEIVPEESVNTNTMNVIYTEKGAYGTQGQSSNLANIRYKEGVSEYILNNIPALRNEKYINNINNYKSSIVYELASTEFNEGEKEYYSTTWEDVTSRINESKNFGNELKKIDFLKEEAIRLRQESKSKEELLENTYAFIQKHMVWNKKRGKFTSQSLKSAFEKKTGNVADINLLLVGLLREIGFQAYPVLTSTKDNGIPIHPTIEGFNYVIAAAEQNGKWILLDATTKITTPGILPIRAINWEGRIVYDNSSSGVLSLSSNKGSRDQVLIDIYIKNDDNVESVFKQRLVNNAALDFRNTFWGLSEKEKKEKFQTLYNVESINNLEIILSDLKKPVTITADINLEDYVETINDKLYFSPMLYRGMTTNPFVADKRDYPIDFVYPKVQRTSVNIDIPLNYEIVSLPENTTINLPENIGNYTFSIIRQEGKLKLTRSFKINQTIVGAKHYNEIKKFYEQIVSKEKEKVVLKKR